MLNASASVIGINKTYAVDMDWTVDTHIEHNTSCTGKSVCDIFIRNDTFSQTIDFNGIDVALMVSSADSKAPTNHIM